MVFISAAKKLHWTYHAQDKMRFYRLSEARVKRVIHSPRRVEEGVAPNTVAMMQPNVTVGNRGQEKWKQEIWVMVEEPLSKAKSQNKGMKIISAWRYPGVTKSRSAVIKDFMKKEYQNFVSTRGESNRTNK